jgi:hypothetical protein
MHNLTAYADTQRAAYVCPECCANPDADGVHPVYSWEEPASGIVCDICHEELVEPLYTVGRNMPGYMPDNEPYAVRGYREALRCLASDLEQSAEHHYAQAEHPDADEDTLTAADAIRWRNLITYCEEVAPSRQWGSEVSFTAPDGLVYWLVPSEG